MAMHEHSNGGFKFYDFCDYILFLNLFNFDGSAKAIKQSLHIYKNFIDGCKDYI